MEISDHLTALTREAELLTEVAQRAGDQAPVPTCPEWRVNDLVRHTGMVHRWATRFVVEELPRHTPGVEPPALTGAELTRWFQEGHRLLYDALATAPDTLSCWAFLPAVSPRAFWARRQAHETTIHRVDAQWALGEGVSAVDPELASDGIDELLAGIHARAKSRVRSQTPRTLRLRTEDTGEVWTVQLSAEPPRTLRSADGPADCEVSGPAGELYQALWNRLPLADLKVTGDGSLTRLWRERSAVVQG